MEFIGRKNELAFLESCYSNPKAQLVILYGRRRVGKTETLREFCKNKDHVFYASQEAARPEQIASFSQRMFEAGSAASRYLSSYGSWEAAFSDIPQLPFSDKKLVVIDEFPYIVKGDASIPSMLQNLWDHVLKDANVMIVLCGSAMSFIEKELLSEKNPLYGRATGILRMDPMPYWDAAKFFPRYSPEEKILSYAVLGGIPHYLSQFDPDAAVGENIKRSILRKGSALYSEVEFLMHEEFRETAVYNSIIQAVALGATRLNEIAQKTMLGSQKASVYLKNLVEVGILEREFSVADSIKEQANGQRGLYRVSDNFFRFWYSTVFANRSSLELFDVDGVYEHEVQPMLGEFASLPFERICADWVRKQNREGHLAFRLTSIGRWWSKGAEIDILGSDKAHKRLLLGECKFTHAKVGMGEYGALAAKAELFRGEESHLYFFSKSGFDRKIFELQRADSKLHLIGIADLFEE